MDLTKLPALTESFKAAFDNFADVAKSIPSSSDSFKNQLVDKIEKSRSETADEIVSILLTKVKADIVSEFKTSLGIE